MPPLSEESGDEGGHMQHRDTDPLRFACMHATLKARKQATTKEPT